MLSDADYQKLSEQLPVVLFDRHMNDSSLPLVITDSIPPTAELVADLARQHPDEIYFSVGSHGFPTRDRLEGFKQGCVMPTSSFARSGSFTVITTPVPATKCSPNCARAWVVRQSAVHCRLWFA
jgi:hypothetical protein